MGNYPDNLAEKLGFKQIQAQIKEACASAMGLEFAEKMGFSSKFHLVQQWTQQVEEMRQLLSEGSGSWPQSDYPDLRPYLDALRLEGNYLPSSDWKDWQRGLYVIYHSIQFFSGISEERYPQLHRQMRDLMEKCQDLGLSPTQLLPIMRQLESWFDDQGQLRENASPTLQNLRQQRHKTELDLRRKLESILQNAQKQGWVSKDFSLSLRNGRMVIPITAEHKRKVKGFVQDESDTGKTVYLEPTEALQANNEIKGLEAAERREIQRILIGLSDDLRPLLPMIKASLQWLGLMDFIRAKAMWAQSHKAILPAFSNTQEMEWKQARHPNLELALKKHGKQMNPLDLRLNERERLMVVSGPNAGGKSVCLSTLGLLQYLFQSGCLVPMAEGSRMGFFQEIFLDMGDDQDLENELSTYSSHLSHMRHFIQYAQNKTLVLVDEFGTGTEPSMGAAIAEAMLEKLADTACFGAINTHFGNLKTLADQRKGLFNAAMKYDTKALKPLYALEIGKPGNSFAFEIAANIGLGQDVIAAAKKKLGQKQVDLDKLLAETAAEKQIWASKNAGIQAQQEALERLKEQYNFLKQGLEREQKSILQAAKLEAKQLLQRSNQQIEQTIRSIKEVQADKEKTKALRQDLQHFEQQQLQVAPAPPTPKAPKVNPMAGPIQVGDWVLLKDGETQAQVLEFKGKDLVLALGAIKSTVKANQVQKIKGPQRSEKARTSVKGIDLNDRMAHFQLTLDLRGKRGEEVYGLLDQYLNDAILLGSNEVRILHGKGDGILRQLVREQLKRYHQVIKVNDEHPDRGGAGISIVQLA